MMAAAGVDFLRLRKSMLGERLGEGSLTRSCCIPSVLLDLVGGVVVVRVLREGAGDMLGVASGDVEVGFVSLREGL